MRRYLLILAIAVATLAGCGQKNVSSSDIENSDNVKVLLFHSAQRCATCRAIEAIVSDVIDSNYAQAIADSSLFVMDIDISDTANRDVVEKYQILSTSLVIDAHGEVCNLTNDAFSFARKDPDKLVQIIKDHLNKALE